nr:DUF3006 domain-containing protein [Paenibacillus caui]
MERFEGDYAVIEIDGMMKDILRAQVSPDACAGDVMEWNGKQWVTDPVATASRTRSIQKLMDDVWND